MGKGEAAHQLGALPLSLLSASQFFVSCWSWSPEPSAQVERLSERFFTAGTAVLVVAGAIALVLGVSQRSLLRTAVGAFLVGPCAVLAGSLAESVPVASVGFTVALASASAVAGLLLVRGRRSPAWFDIFVGLGIAALAMASWISALFGSTSGSFALAAFVCLGAAACVYGVLVDTEIDRARHQRELDVARDQIQEDRHRFDDLLHDLRSGLLGIEAASVAVVDERAKVLADEAARLRAMTDRERTRDQPFDLIRGVRGLAAAGQCEGIQIDLRSPDRVEVVGSESQLLSVVQNLIENGRRHGDGSILIEIDEVDGDLQLSVSDQGDGPTEGRDRLFERGYTTHGDGSGVGLAAARRLAEANSGSLEFSPTLDRPSRFVITLPVAQADMGREHGRRFNRRG